MDRSRNWAMLRACRRFASPYDEGIAFLVTRGEGDASAAWIGPRQPHHMRNGRSKSLDASGGGDGPRPRPRHPHLGPPSDLARLSAAVLDVAIGELSPWRSVLPPSLQRR